MQVKYKGDYPIKFISMDGFSGIIQPEDTLEINDDIYNSEYKDDPRYEAILKAKKNKGAE